MPTILNNKGYTLLESVLQLIIFAFIALSMPIIFSTLQHSHEKFVDNTDETWEMFTLDIRQYLNSGVKVHIYEDALGLRVYTDNEFYDFSKFGTEIRKRRNLFGFEPMLENVNDVHFSRNGKYVTVKVQFNDNTDKSRKFTLGDTIE